MHLKGAKLEEAVFRLEAIGTRMGFRTPFFGTLFLGNECFFGVFFFGSFKLDSKVPEFPNKRRTGDFSRILPHKVSVPF